MKILRRLLILMLVLAIGCIAAGLFVRHRVREIPSWYRHLDLDDHTQRLAANSMNQKLLETYGRANDELSAAARAEIDPANTPTVDPTAPVTIELSEAEINSFFADWDNIEHWRRKISKYVVDPVVILEDHELIIAGMLTDWSMLVSLHFEPRLENGKLNVDLKSVMMGTLQLPRSSVQGYFDKIDATIAAKMPSWQAGADIGVRGWANSDALAAAMGELLTRTLNNQPAEPIVMLRDPMKTSDPRHMPMRITHLEIADKTIRLTLRLLTRDEREALFEHLRGQDPAQTASAK